MSAISNPQITPQQTPVKSPAPPVRTIQIEKPPSGKGKWIVLGLALLAAVGGAIGYQRWKAQQQQAAANLQIIKTAKVEHGSVQKVMRLAGQTSAMTFTNVIVPKSQGPEAGRELILLYMVKSGTMVKKGEKIAEIDGQALKDHIDDVTDEVTQSQADIRKREAEQAIDRENLNQSIRVAKAAWDKAKLDLGAAETRTAIDQELLKLTADEAEARYKQLLADLQQKEITYKAEIRILQITTERHKRHLGRHAADLKRYVMYADMDGLAVAQPIFRSGEWGMIQQGDQVQPAQLIMKIVKPDSMQVEANINQAESEMFRIGQRASIGIDAFPGLQMPGRIFSINAIAAGGWRQNNYIRNIPVRISIDKADPRVIPDLSASVDVVIEKQDGVNRAPLQAIHEEGGKSFVYVKNGPKWDKREVTLGLKSATHAAVLTGVQPGEELALEKPRA
jgi:multidrug resistance efflux pump